MYYQKEMEAENQAVKSQFFIRLTSLPVVHSALGHATSAYGRVKQTNSLIDYTLSTVEKSVLYANEKAQPIVKKFETHIVTADNFACKSLDKLEQTVPIIKEPTEKILQDTRTMYVHAVQSGLDRYNNIRAYGSEKVSAVKNYGTGKANELLTSEYAKLLTSTVDGALSLTENCIDLYLPASKDEDKTDPKEKPVLERMSYLSTVVQRRARKLAVLKLQEIQQATQTTVANINIHERLGQLKALPENVYTNVIWVWGELNKVPEPVPEGTNLPIRQQAWSTAQQMTQTAVSTYNSAVTTIQTIPSHLQSSVSSAYLYTINVYTTVQKFSVDKLPEPLVHQARETLHLLNQLPAFQWLVHVYQTQTSTQSSSSSTEEHQ